MKSSDIVLALIIILVFVALLVFNVLSVGITKVNDDWDKYRCSPGVIPFASIFGHDTAENLKYCIQTMQSNHMGALMAPFTGQLDIMSGITKQFNETLGSTTGMIGKIRMWVTSLIKTIITVFMNIIIQFQRIIYNLKDVLSKVSAMMMTFMNIITSLANTAESLWEGPPGDLVRSMCFDPTTKIELQNGEVVSIQDMPLNAKLKNNAVVHSVLKLSNVKEDGTQLETMYSVKGGVQGENIIVSANHLVYDAKIKQFVKVKDFRNNNVEKLNTKNHPVLYCLITSDHTIPIGNYIFHDWEDNNGSPSKTLV